MKGVIWGGFLTPWAHWQMLLHSNTPSRLGQLISIFTSKTGQFPGNLFHENAQVTVQFPKYQYAGKYQISATGFATHVGITLEGPPSLNTICCQRSRDLLAFVPFTGVPSISRDFTVFCWYLQRTWKLLRCQYSAQLVK